MAEKANPIIDDLNKILTITLDYKEVLEKLSKSISHDATKDKLRELAQVKNTESQQLMDIIKQSGGRIESSERVTDQEALYWVSRPLPDPGSMKSVLNKLIDTERNAKEDYGSLLSQKEIESDHEEMLTKMKKEAEANLEYFQSASQSLDKKTI